MNKLLLVSALLLTSVPSYSKTFLRCEWVPFTQWTEVSKFWVDSGGVYEVIGLDGNRHFVPTSKCYIKVIKDKKGK